MKPLERPLQSPLAVIFLTVFIDLLGFGILIPLQPQYAERFGASATAVGLLAAVYSLTQLIFAPLWGRLSDRLGRRRVLMATAGGAAVAYLVFGLADSLWLLFVSRAFAGACGGNIATAQAYIADVTTAENRSRGMAIIGAGFGLGFTLGPALAVVASAGGVRAPFFVAAGLAALNTVWIALALPEPQRHEGRPRRGLGSYADAFRIRPLAALILILLTTTYAFSHVEAAFALFNAHELGFSERDNGLAFTFIGVVLTLVQLGVVRRLATRVSPRTMMMVGTASMALGAAALPLARAWWQLGPPLLLLASGNAFYQPSIIGAMSTSAPADRQGEMLGVAQSAGAVGRIAGPAAGGLLFDHAGRASPFFAAAGLMVLACAALSATPARRRDRSKEL